jgi:hypothetical protein
MNKDILHRDKNIHFSIIFAIVLVEQCKKLPLLCNTRRTQSVLSLWKNLFPIQM